MFIIGFLAAITTVKVFQAVQVRRRQERHRLLDRAVRGKSRFNGNNGFRGWSEEVRVDRRRPELMEVTDIKKTA